MKKSKQARSLQSGMALRWKSVLGLRPFVSFLWCKRLLWNIDWNNMATLRIRIIRVSTATQPG